MTGSPSCWQHLFFTFWWFKFNQQQQHFFKFWVFKSNQWLPPHCKHFLSFDDKKQSVLILQDYQDSATQPQAIFKFRWFKFSQFLPPCCKHFLSLNISRTSSYIWLAHHLAGSIFFFFKFWWFKFSRFCHLAASIFWVLMIQDSQFLPPPHKLFWVSIFQDCQDSATLPQVMLRFWWF